MAILKHLVVLLLVTSIFPGCTSLRETNPAPQAREGIAWIERQFNSGYFFHIAYLLPCDNFNGYGFRFGKTLAAAA